MMILELTNFDWSSNYYKTIESTFYLPDDVLTALNQFGAISFRVVLVILFNAEVFVRILEDENIEYSLSIRISESDILATNRDEFLLF